MNEPQDPIRQMLIQARRAQILSGAAEVFSHKGFQGATIREIAAKAGVAEGTLYNYFDGKREMLLAIADEAEWPALFALLEETELGDRAAMVSVMEKALDLSEARLPFIKALLSEAWIDDAILTGKVFERVGLIHQQLTEYIARHTAAGIFRPIDPDLGARLLLGMFGALILPTFLGVEPLPSAEERHVLAETIVGMLLDGILAPGTEESAR